MSCDSNDDELKLTEEYKYLLSYIRPLIDQLDKSRDAQLCLLWLSKLEQCSSWERNYRNKILSELCKQVKSNCLKPPFSAAPPKGPLRNVMCGVWKTLDWVSNNCSEIDVSTEEVCSIKSHQLLNPPKNFHKHQIFSAPRKRGCFCNNLKNNSKPPKEILDHSECFAVQKAYQERAENDRIVIARYQDIIKSLVSRQSKDDISPSRRKKLQAAYENKLTELVHSLKKVQEENDMLKRKLGCFEGDSDHLDILKNENETLREQIIELQNEKNALETKCKQLDNEKVLSMSEFISKLNELEQKLKDSEKSFKSLEKKYEKSCREFESEIHARSSEKEKLQLAQLCTFENLLEEKQAEINSMKEQMSSQSAYYEQEISRLKQQLEGSSNFVKEKEKFCDLISRRLSSQNVKHLMEDRKRNVLNSLINSCNIKNLKSKAKKLEKIREHMTVLFQSQLQQILAKKDFYIASLEMQLKMSSSESGGSIYSSDFSNLIDQKISNLEEQYRKLLEDSEQQSIKRRQLDLQKIHSLEKQLLSLGGVVANGEPDAVQVKESSPIPECVFEGDFNTGKAF